MMASNEMKYVKLAEMGSRERHMKNISPVPAIYPDTSIWTFYSYNNKYIKVTQEDNQINKVVHSTSTAM